VKTINRGSECLNRGRVAPATAKWVGSRSGVRARDEAVPAPCYEVLRCNSLHGGPERTARLPVCVNSGLVLSQLFARSGA
jgi:hypothetical protein